jgi:hypothetical protein
MIIHQSPLEIGGHVVETSLSLNHDGRCAIVSGSGNQVIAIVPSFSEACRIAKYAVTPDGGYGSVRIESSVHECTDDSFQGWIFR